MTTNSQYDGLLPPTKLKLLCAPYITPRWLIRERESRPTCWLSEYHHWQMNWNDFKQRRLPKTVIYIVVEDLILMDGKGFDVDDGNFTAYCIQMAFCGSYWDGSTVCHLRWCWTRRIRIPVRFSDEITVIRDGVSSGIVHTTIYLYTCRSPMSSRVRPTILEVTVTITDI